MRLLRTLLATVTVAATLVAVVDASPATRSFRAAGPVGALGVGGHEIAYSAEHRPGCHEVRVWDTRDRGVRRYASHCFASTSTGSGVAAVAVSGRRTLWLTYTGGNIREWSLWTKTRTSSARRIAFAAADVDGPAPLVVGSAWTDALPYAAGRRVLVLRANGARRFAVDLPERVVSLSAHSAGVAAVLASGSVVTITPAGKVVREHKFAPGEVDSALLTGVGLIVRRADGLLVRGAGGDDSIALPLGARLFGYLQNVILYGVGDELRVRHRKSGEDALVRRIGARFRAGLSTQGAGFALGRTVGLVPSQEVRAAALHGAG